MTGSERRLADVLAGTRLAFAAGVALAPARTVRALVGSRPGPRAITVGRLALAARDLAVGIATLRAREGDVPARLRLGAACDAGDAVAIVATWRALPPGGRRAVLLSALTGATAHWVVAERLGGRR